ncbi:hypothetical protein [uncultured Winogradskyella sp.]|uniref:hypothetical protein n=1 Tax=uncultured Winogradskyella sp. TaxID=395353 RepID=UPI00261C7521|nr:hypothetical protein [uncultured Winogradskyella sp.]
MNVRILITTLIFIVCSQYIVSQTKKEKEQRIKRSHFPVKAQNILNYLPKDCKRIKYYKETDGNKQSFETKFKYNRQWFSLEFSPNGRIEDLEVIITIKTINSPTKIKIENYFNTKYLKYKLIKVQKQFVFDQNSNVEGFITNILNHDNGTIVNYEIIAEVKTEKSREMREFTFNQNGAFINFRVIKPTSYEYVLY